jgi:hypothetical protein
MAADLNPSVIGVGLGVLRIRPAGQAGEPSADVAAARPKDRRIALPSMTTPPKPSWPRQSRKLAKQVAKAVGSSRRNRRENMS